MTSEDAKPVVSERAPKTSSINPCRCRGSKNTGCPVGALSHVKSSCMCLHACRSTPGEFREPTGVPRAAHELARVEGAASGAVLSAWEPSRAEPARGSPPPFARRCQATSSVCSWWRRVSLESPLWPDLSLNRVALLTRAPCLPGGARQPQGGCPADAERELELYEERRFSLLLWLHARRAHISALALTSERCGQDGRGTQLRMAVAGKKDRKRRPGLRRGLRGLGLGRLPLNPGASKRQNKHTALLRRCHVPTQQQAASRPADTPHPLLRPRTPHPRPLAPPLQACWARGCCPCAW